MIVDVWTCPESTGMNIWIIISDIALEMNHVGTVISFLKTE